MVNRVKPQFMVHGFVHDFVHGFVHGSVHDFVHGLWCPSFMLDYPVLFPSDVHLDFGQHCDTQWYLRLQSEPFHPTQTIRF